MSNYEDCRMGDGYSDDDQYGYWEYQKQLLEQEQYEQWLAEQSQLIETEES